MDTSNKCTSCNNTMNRQLDATTNTCVCKTGYFSTGSEICQVCYLYMGQCVNQCPQVRSKPLYFVLEKKKKCMTITIGQSVSQYIDYVCLRVPNSFIHSLYTPSLFYLHSFSFIFTLLLSFRAPLSTKLSWNAFSVTALVALDVAQTRINATRASRNRTEI